MPSAAEESRSHGTWLGLPVYSDEAPAFPRLASNFLLVSMFLFLAVLLVVAPEQITSPRGIGPALLAVVAAVVRVLVWRGRVRAATGLLIVGAWSYVSVISIFTGGLRANPVYVFPMIIIMAGWRLGPAFGAVLAGLTVAVNIGFYLAETAGILPPPMPTPPALPLLVQSMTLIFAAILVSTLVRSFWMRIDEARILGAELAASNAEVKAREADLNEAQNVAQIGSWTFDVAADTGHLTPEACRIFGAPEGGSISQANLLQHVHADDRAMLAQSWRDACEKKTAFNLDYRIATAGEPRWVRQVARLEFAPDGKPLRALGTVQDITERKRIEAELESHRAHLEELVKQRTDALLATEARASRILESSADGLYGVDVDGRITFINRAGCTLLGYEAAQVIGRSAHDLFHHSKPDGSPFPAAECEGHRAWRDGRQVRIDEATYWHADGHPVPVAISVHPMHENDRLIGAVVSFADTSEQRAAVVARERALVAAENLARARSEFLANMSHEIRTPMNGMLGFAQIGQRNYQNPEKARNAFDKIIASGNQLLGVVNEILDFSKIDAGQLKVEAAEMSLAETLDRAIELVAERARAKGLELRLDKAPDFPERCVSDPLRIGQILLNLLSNAVKFTEAGQVTLSASRHGDELVFRVADTGIGMSEEQLGYVFNPFQQADGSTTRKFGGTGLGLAICKRLLELMHGTIRVESLPGAGSRFEFRLPYVAPGAPMPAAASLPAVLPERPLAGLSILVAEDDGVNRLMLEANLEEDGARLVMVGDGREAVERVRQDGAAAYDVVLMDIQMPEMDGYEATRRILELAPGLPIIGQTAHAFAEERDKCYAVGMVGHIAKPIDPQALARLILKVVPTVRPRNS